MSSPSREEIETTLASLASIGAFPELGRPGAAALAWLAAPLRLIWASPAAAEVAAALVVDGAGSVASSLPAGARLAALAAGLAPRDRVRLEKLRFETSAFAPLSTCACRIVSLPDGASVLVTIFVERLPRLGVRPRPTPPPEAAAARIAAETAASGLVSSVSAAPEPSGVDAPHDSANARAPDIAPTISPEPEPEPEAEPAPEPPATIRFLWESDAEGRITRITGGLSEAVGPDSANVVGRRLAELVGERVHDPKNIVVELIARGETFSGRTLHWRVGDSEEAAPVDLAGLPVRDRERRIVGYRGFGLCRPRNRLPWLPPAPVAQPSPEAGGQGAPFDPLPAAPAPEIFAEPRALTPPALIIEPAEEAVEAPPVEARPAQEPASGAATAPAEIGEEMTVAETSDEGAAHEGPSEEAALPDEAGSPAARRDSPALSFGSIAGRVGASFGSAPAAANAPEPPPPAAGHAEAQPAASAAPQNARTARTALTETERNAFREIARALGAALPGDAEASETEVPETEAPETEDQDTETQETEAQDTEAQDTEAQETEARKTGLAQTGQESAAASDVVADDGLARVVLAPANDLAPDSRAVLDRLPAGVVVNRGERAIFVNRYLLDLLGYEDLDAFQRDGGLARLFRARPGALEGAVGDSTAPLSIATREGGTVAVEVRLTTVDWCGAPASMLMLRKVAEADPAQRLRAMELDLLAREESLREQAAILDTATDGVALLDQNGRILSLNRAAEALFGYDQREVTGEPFTLLLQTESHVAALGYLEAMRGEGLGALLNDGREVLGRERQGGAIPLFMTLGLIGEGLERKFCVVLRDMTAFKQAESELVAARRAAERASAQKSDFLAKISHEIRTPLNAIIGFAEVMLEERFGPVGNERYRDYVADIHASGAHVISLVNDLLDLAKIEAGRMELTFGAVALNDVVGSCVALMQPQAARDRIVLRTSFGENVPPVEADERALRQIVLNLLSNAVKFTDAGGQVIVSTAVSGSGEVVFRVRDTGIGMNEADIETALEPFRQLATSRRGGGTGLGLPLTKALVEANRGTLKISSRRGEGTLVEVALRPVPASVG